MGETADARSLARCVPRRSNSFPNDIAETLSPQLRAGSRQLLYLSPALQVIISTSASYSLCKAFGAICHKKKKKPLEKASNRLRRNNRHSTWLTQGRHATFFPANFTPTPAFLKPSSYQNRKAVLGVEWRGYAGQIHCNHPPTGLWITDQSRELVSCLESLRKIPLTFTKGRN